MNRDTQLEPEAPSESVPVENGQEHGQAASIDEAAARGAREASNVDETGQFLKGLVEALIFVSDHPIELKELARAAKIDKKRAGELVEELSTEYAGRGIRLDEVGGGLAFRSDPRYADYVRGYLALRPVRLSRPQLETLAIVAYRQPITRPEIDEIRGVDAGPVLKGLLERDLIRIIGKKDEPGRPMLYGTTQTFLQVFSLKSLRDLPTLREFTELNDDSRRAFEREIGEEPPELGLTGDPEGEAQALPGTGDEAGSEALVEGVAAAAAQPSPPDDDDDEDDEDEDDDDEDDEDDDGEDDGEEGDEDDDEDDDDDDDEEDEDEEDDDD